MTDTPAQTEAFIARWQGREGGQERVNYGLFLSELCDALGVPRPDPAAASTGENDYVFERAVKSHAADGSSGAGRIDLYKRGSFVLEAKQSRQPGAGPKEVAVQYLPGLEPPRRGVRDASRTWDVLMLNARRQAEGYARALPVEHGWPPFILVCDVGHVIETYADFSGQGKNYAQFPDRQSFRIYLEDLRRPEIRERLARIWTDPMGLDPARETARVTRAIAERLAAVSKALEDQGHDAEEVAMFLMRCLFTMFAEDVELLPKSSFRDLLRRCEQDPSRFAPMVGQLWGAMDRGDFAYALETKVRRFNGEFFRTRTALPLGRAEIGELRRAASYDWREVDPSIFGTLLEQALDKSERRRLGAHYTPRAYVERLVVATVIEPLRSDWEQALSTAERQKASGRGKEAVATVRAFHDKLCQTRILDPACGTGNFLYVSLELLKRLEGEVLESLANLGGQEALTGLEGHTVDPHQFLGLELNPRAAAIAELVLWIGYLQWHFRTQDGMPGEPILHAFKNIEGKFDAVLKADVSLVRDALGMPVTRRGPDGSFAEVYAYDNPCQPEWPAAEFIVGNPPFIGNKRMREVLGQGYVDAVWSAHPAMVQSADFVMLWWDHAATLLSRPTTCLRRFGLVTTNSITHVFQRRVTEQHLRNKPPISIIMAIPDHPWTKAARDTAAVRIAMTVCEAGERQGHLLQVTRESQLETDSPSLELTERSGKINSDLTIGIDSTTTVPLLSNQNMSFRGITFLGAGFVLRQSDSAYQLFVSKCEQAAIRPYLSGRDLVSRSRNVFIIDLYGLTLSDVRSQYPSIYQHLATTVKPLRDNDNRGAYRINWWIFAEPRPEFREATEGLACYVAISQTAKHIAFQFVPTESLPDQTLVAIATDDAYDLGVLSSRAHRVWVLSTGATLEDRPRYSNSRCFDPFPFPSADDLQKQRIRGIAEDLDALRKVCWLSTRTSR